MNEKNLQLERLVFFSDAVVAIAITLLALDIEIEPIQPGQLHYADIGAQWRTFAAFGLSFFNIANFWVRHHTFFVYINRIDERVVGWNILWLLFIILLPFSTALVSNYFSQPPAMVVYSLCMLLIAVCQNALWDYASEKGFLNPEKTTHQLDQLTRTFSNLEMINSALGLGVAFFSPAFAFIILLTKLPIIVLFRLKPNLAGNYTKPPFS